MPAGLASLRLMQVGWPAAVFVVAGRTDCDAVFDMLGCLGIRNVAVGGAALVAVLEYRRIFPWEFNIPGISGYRIPNSPSCCH